MQLFSICFTGWLEYETCLLQAGNVLLKTHRIDRRGYIAKVADFGEPPHQ